MEKDYLTTLNYLGLFSRLKRLSETTLASGRNLYQHIDIGIEPNWFLIFRIIIEREETSISEISSILKFSHPSVISIVKKMDKAGYLNITAHSTDKRKQIIKLSEKAQQQLPEMERVWDASEDAVASLFTDDTFLTELGKVERALEEKSFFYRVLTNLNEKEIIIRPFTAKDSRHFAELNEQWLLQYFSIEPIDQLVLHNPEEQILNKNGLIFMASIKENVIGTVALIAKNDHEIELSKMAVNPEFQGKGIGKKLLQKAIETARELSYTSLILYSNTKLTPAINLYKRFGFTEIELEPEIIYDRADIKMILPLTND